MPYQPGVTDRSGELVAAGIGGAGDAITQAIKDAKRMKDEAALLRSHLNDAVTSGALPSETGAELVKEFMAGNHRKKMEIGLSAQLATKRHETEQARLPEWARIAIGEKGQTEGTRQFDLSHALAKSEAENREKDRILARILGLREVKVKERAEDRESELQKRLSDPDFLNKLTEGTDYKAAPAHGVNFLPLSGGKTSSDPSTWPRVSVNGQEMILVPKGAGTLKATPKTGGTSVSIDDRKADEGAAKFYAVHGGPTLWNRAFEVTR